VGIRSRSDKALAAKFVDAVQALNDRLEIPRQLAALHEDDIAALAKAACWEADTNYPVPRQMSQKDCEGLLRAVLPVTVEAAPKRKAAPRAGARKPQR
jgi:alcohol dehydrogenase class IV